MGYLYVLLAAFLWGLIGPLSRMAFQEGLTPLTVAFYRALLSWIFFLAHAARTGGLRVAPRDLPVFPLFGLLGVALFYGAYQLAVLYGGRPWPRSSSTPPPPGWPSSPGPSSGSPHGQVLGGGGLDPPRGGAFGPGRGERGALRGAGLPLRLGLRLLLRPSLPSRQALPRPLRHPTFFAYALPVAALALAPWAEFGPLTPRALGALLALSLFSTYGAYLAFYAGLRRLPATVASVVATLEPVVAVVLAYLLFGEVLSPLGYFGALLVILAVLLAVRR